MKTDMLNIKEVLRVVKSSTIEVKLCPRCLQNYFTPYGSNYVELVSPPFPALSRVDNVTYICSECGMREAFEETTGMGWEPAYGEHKYWEDPK